MTGQELPAVESAPEGLQPMQSGCSDLERTPCYFATCVNEMADVALRWSA